MNEQLQKALADLLNMTIEGLDAGVAFMQAELPVVVSQLLLWYGVKSLLLCLYGILAVSLTAIVWWKWFKYCKNSGKIDCDEFTTIFMPAIIAIVPIVSGVSSLNMEWLQICIAPKIWLIEYAAQFAK